MGNKPPLSVHLNKNQIPANQSIDRDFVCSGRAHNPFLKEIKRTEKRLTGVSGAHCKYSDFLLNTHIFLFFDN